MKVFRLSSKRAIGNLGLTHPKLEYFGKFSAVSNPGDSPVATVHM
jgi:hypothetical protein